MEDCLTAVITDEENEGHYKRVSAAVAGNLVIQSVVLLLGSPARLFLRKMSSSEAEDEEDVPKVVLPQRATRGNRMQNVSCSKIMEVMLCPVVQPLAVMRHPTLLGCFVGNYSCN